MNVLGVRGFTVALGVTALAGALVGASPERAAAAEYNGVCGSGYSVVNQVAVGDSGTTFLTYNDSNGYNCAVTVRDDPGAPVEMVVGLKRTPDGASEAVEDSGQYTTYAGPVYLHAAGTCVDWFGYIDGDNGHKNGTNCG